MIIRVTKVDKSIRRNIPLPKKRIPSKHIVLGHNAARNFIPKEGNHTESILEKIKDKERIFILLPGSSLNDIKEEYWGKLKNETTFCVNRAYKKFPKTNFIIWGDKVESYEIMEFYKDSTTHPHYITRANTIYNNTTDKFPKLLSKEFVESIKFWFNESKSKLYGNITPVWLMQLLVGFTGKVYLLGCDFYIKNDMYHYENYMIDYYKSRKYDKRLESFLRQFQNSKFINELKLINLNQDSKFRKCQFEKIEDVLK